MQPSCTHSPCGASWRQENADPSAWRSIPVLVRIAGQLYDPRLNKGKKSRVHPNWRKSHRDGVFIDNRNGYPAYLFRSQPVLLRLRRKTHAKFHSRHTFPSVVTRSYSWTGGGPFLVLGTSPRTGLFRSPVSIPISLNSNSEKSTTTWLTQGLATQSVKTTTPLVLVGVRRRALV